MKQKTEVHLKMHKKKFSLKKESIKNFRDSKIILAVAMFLLLTGASTYSNAQVQLGVKASGSASCLSDLLELCDNDDLKLNTNFGVLAKYPVNNWFAIKSGLDFEQKGREYDLDGTTVKEKLSYLTLPVKAEFSAGEKAGFKNGQRFFFAVGPYVGCLLDAEKETGGNSLNLKDDTKSFDGGLAFELGIEFPVFNDRALQVGLNYDMGFTEIYKTVPDLHNKTASINLGILF